MCYNKPKQTSDAIQPRKPPASPTFWPSHLYQPLEPGGKVLQFPPSCAGQLFGGFEAFLAVGHHGQCCVLLGGASSGHFPWVGGEAIFNAQHRFKGSREADTLLSNGGGSSHLKAEILGLPALTVLCPPRGRHLQLSGWPKGCRWQLGVVEPESSPSWYPLIPHETPDMMSCFSREGAGMNSLSFLCRCLSLGR